MAAIGDPAWIRTKDLLLRRQLLYPAELPDQSGGKIIGFLAIVEIGYWQADLKPGTLQEINILISH